MKRAEGLLIKALAGSIGADQALQVESGRAALPVRVLKTTPGLVEDQRRCPQRENDGGRIMDLGFVEPGTAAGRIERKETRGITESGI